MRNNSYKLIESFSDDIERFKEEDVGKKFLDANHHIFQSFEDLLFIPQGDDEV